MTATKRWSSVLTHTAAVLQLGMAAGHLLVSDATALTYVRELGASPYWQSRLQATLWAGSLGRAFTGVVLLVGSRLVARGEPAALRAGRVLLALSVLPVLASAVLIPALSPQDSARALAHGAVIALTLGGLALLGTAAPDRAAVA